MERGTNPAKCAGRSDEELLAQFSSTASEEAFRQIVERYLGMVFSVALRKLRNRQWAEEAAQSAFSALARRAPQFRKGTVLGAWLHRVVWTECAEILRREIRRNEIMKIYAESAKTDQCEHPPEEILQALDEAMAHLPARDRDLLMLRFHSGFAFREIGRRLGTTEEAGRKRVERALEKLSEALSQRGLTASSAVVTSGLTGAWSGAAPAGLAAVVTQSALGGAGASAIGAFAFLNFMSQAQLKIAVGTGLILVGTISFFAGRHEAKAFHGVAGAPAAQAAPAQFWSAPLRAPGAQARPDPQLGGRMLIERAVQAVREANDGTDAHYAALLALQPMRSEDVPEAVALLESIEDRKVLQALVPIVAGVWARSDGLAASAWVQSVLEGENALGSGYRRVLRSWAGYDPEAAYGWYQEKAAAGMDGIPPNSFRWLPSEVFGEWARSNPWRAAAALNTIPMEDQLGAMQGFCDALERSVDPTPIVSALQGMPEGPRKGELIRKVSKRWAKAAPEAAAAWFDTLWVNDPGSQFRTRAEIAEEWIAQDKTALIKAGAWLLAGTPNEMRGEILRALDRERARIAQEHPAAQE